MAKSPQFPLYPRDLVADTVHLSCEQFGAYVRLLCAAWQGVGGCPQCHLPKDDEGTLAMITGLAVDRWRKIGQAVTQLLSVSADGSHYFSKRLLEELGKQQERSRKARESVEKRTFRPIERFDETQSNDSQESIERLDKGQSKANPRAGARVATLLTANSSTDQEQEKDLEAYARAVAELHPRAVLPYELSRCLYDMRATLPPLPEFVETLKAWARSEDWTKDGGKWAPGAVKWITGGGWKTRPRPQVPSARRSASAIESSEGTGPAGATVVKRY